MRKSAIKPLFVSTDQYSTILFLGVAIEKIIFPEIALFLGHSNIFFYTFQPGFRPHHHETVDIQVVNNFFLSRVASAQNHCSAPLSVFDGVDHNIMQGKLMQGLSMTSGTARDMKQKGTGPILSFKN